MSLWKYQSDIEQFSDTNNVSDDRRKEIINVMLSDDAVRYWNYGSIFRSLLKHIDADLAFKIFKHYIDKGESYSFDSNSDYEIATKVYNMYNDKAEVKKVIRTCKSKRVRRALLIIEDMSVEDETIGLRALSGLKYPPDTLYEFKYKPSVDAVKALPPIMRLSALETLLNNNNMAYNIFDNFADPEEFKALLFSATLRHRDRVEAVWDKFNEASNLGTEATVMVKYLCPNCGDIDVSIKSMCARTPAGLSNTRLGAFLNYQSCPLCGRYGDDIKKSFTCLEDN